ncbi:hypothetical protein [Ferruginibacter sp. SUN106]|uniref:hypothetical protein n=1 Tax=Ferruginibacter sp. SUN106 TaxID=2978348 RepID=UPI003D35FA15
MTSKKTIAILLAATTIVTTSCFKDPVAGSNGNYLKFSNATLALKNTKGARGAVQVQSNTGWKLSIEAPAPDWMTVNKMAGTNNDSLIVFAAKDNNTGGYKFANIIATSVNDSLLRPVRVTVVQYDSSYKGK